MPRKVKAATKSYVCDFSTAPEEEDAMTSSPATEKVMLQSTSKKRGKERNFSKDDSDDDVEDEQPMSSILHQFGAEIKKTISSKRRKLENFTKQCNSSREKLDKLLEEQKKSRTHLYEEFKKQMVSLLGQWEADIDRVKESEEKLNSLWNQQIKLLSQIRVVQSQRYKSMKQLHEQYCKSVNEVDSNQEVQHKSATNELHQELANLQRKFLMETRNQEMANMKKSLQSMLYQ